MKITVVGAGNVGATTAQRLADLALAREVVLVDVLEGVPQGKALDMYEATPVGGADVRVIGTNDYALTANSDIVVITAGIARKPGMSRDDLQNTNATIMKSVAEQVKTTSPNAILIVVSNPLDVMTYVALKVSGFPAHRVIGMAGVLDTSRYRSFIAEAANVSVEDVQAMVLGGHGDSMVPLVRYTTIAGMPVTNFVDSATLDTIVTRTRNGGIEIVNYLKTGSAYYAPSASVIQMVQSIVYNKHRILPCSIMLTGEYGLNGVVVGVPVKLGTIGVEEVVNVPLADEERAALMASASAVKSQMDKVTF
jgi:malate dehydrogenase